jgi:hypothetical protein
MSKPVTIHKSRIIRLLKQYPNRLREIFPAGRFTDATKAIRAIQLSPYEWFIDGTLAENERVAAKVTNVRNGNSLVSFSRNAVSNGTGVNVIDVERDGH